MNIFHESTPRRSWRPGAAVASLLATVAVGALLGNASLAEEMYHSPTNSEGGVVARATITSQTTVGTNTTLCWYGMQGWYSVEMSTNGGFEWVSVGRTVASEHSACLTVNNGGNEAPLFRLNQNNAYVGQGGCSGCHGDKHSEWSETAHAGALNSLKAIGMDKDASCLPCHTVGFGQPTGYTDITNTPHLSDVGCETCHGPAGWHKFSDHDIVRPAVTLDPKICGGCHQDSHHPTYEEWETSPHAEVLDDIKYGFTGGLYVPSTTPVSIIWGTNVVAPGTSGSSNCYGFYITTNANLTLKTNYTTGIIHSGNGPGTGFVYDPGQDRAVSCGICHSAGARMVMIQDWEARQEGRTNALHFPSAQDSAAWGAACATCHDPHDNSNPGQLRNPTRSTNYYTMATTTDKRTVYSTNFMGAVTTNVVFYSAAFANMYDPNVQVCAQCHNSRGARWDGRSFGFITNGASITFGLQTNISGLSRPPHHSPQYNFLIGILQPDYFNTNSSGVATNMTVPHGVALTRSGTYNTNQCATCHVPSYAVNAGTNVTGHTFAMDTKNCTISGCHGSVPLYEETMLANTNAITRIVSLLNQWGIAKGPALGLTKGANNWDYTTTGVLAPTPNTSNAGPNATDQATKIPDVIKQARFNIYMLLHDGSLGVHNPTYATALLTDAETKVLNQFPTANFKAFTLTGFTNLSVGFTNLGTGATNWAWNFGDGNTSTLANPTNVYTAPGVYNVSLTANGETVVRSNYITVALRPTVRFSADQRTNATPMTVNFTNLSTLTNSVTLWRWSFSGGNLPSSQVVYSQNASFTFSNLYTTNLTFTIALRGYTPGGNITSTSNNWITVTP